MRARHARVCAGGGGGKGGEATDRTNRAAASSRSAPSRRGAAVWALSSRAAPECEWHTIHCLVARSMMVPPQTRWEWGAESGRAAVRGSGAFAASGAGCAAIYVHLAHRPLLGAHLLHGRMLHVCPVALQRTLLCRKASVACFLPCVVCRQLHIVCCMLRIARLHAAAMHTTIFCSVSRQFSTSSSCGAPKRSNTTVSWMSCDATAMPTLGCSSANAEEGHRPTQGLRAIEQPDGHTRARKRLHGTQDSEG